MKVQKDITASFDIDCQKGFTPICPNELPVPGGHLIVDECNKNATKARLRVGSGDFHPVNAVWLATEEKPQLTHLPFKNANIAWNAHCMSGTKGAELLDGLPLPVEYDFFVFKGIAPDLHPFSPCYHDLEKKMSTGVIEWLKTNNIHTVICGGLALEYCYGEGVKDLLRAGFSVIANLASTKGLTGPADQEKFIDEIIEVSEIFGYNFEVINSADEIENI